MKLTLIIFVSILWVGCLPHKSEPSDIVFENTIESSYAWTDNKPSNVISYPQAHSGSYVCKIDASAPFSPTLFMRINQISDKKLSNVKFVAYIKKSNPGSDPKLVVEIHDKDNKNLEWIAESATEGVSEENDWIKVTKTVDLRVNHRNEKDNYLRIYVSNGALVFCYVDDIQITFETE